jgi:hypothetical protein
MKFFILFSLLLFSVYSFDFTGDGTFYGGAGKGGSCTSSYIPNGFTTVAINKPQYRNGLGCGSCLEGVLHLETEDRNFKAIIDNLCNECAFGSLDFGEIGDGRWSVEWSFISCPSVPLIITTQGSNSFFGKIKIEGGGPINSVSVNDLIASSTNDAYWEVNDLTGSLGCGPKLHIFFENNNIVDMCIDGSLFDSSCSGNVKCDNLIILPTIASINTPEISNIPEITNTPEANTNTLTNLEECIDEWKQCDGINYIGKKCCKLNFTCIFINEWYSQCQLIDTGNCQKKWDQCGGKFWSGLICCNIGSTCVFINDWYSQCLQ